MHARAHTHTHKAREQAYSTTIPSQYILNISYNSPKQDDTSASVSNSVYLHNINIYMKHPTSSIKTHVTTDTKIIHSMTSMSP
jgi:hypothetical protein